MFLLYQIINMRMLSKLMLVISSIILFGARTMHPPKVTFKSCQSH